MPIIDFKDDKSAEFVNKLYSIIFENEGSWPFFPGRGSGPRADHKYDFPNGKVMFLVNYVNAALNDEMREMKTDFGILPYPKYDESQKDYYSRIEGCEMSGIPNTVTDKARTSAVIEALASISATTVEPAYYDIVLKSQAARDNDSSEMLDIIFANRVFDLGDTIWCDTLRDGVFETMFMQDDRNLSSKLDSVTPVLESKIQDSVEAFMK
jgi:hypothetical protein